MNLVGFLFLVFATITFNFPSLAPVDKDNMNYTSVVVGLILLISLLTWIFDGRKNFTGSRSGIMDAIEAEYVGLDPGVTVKPDFDRESGSGNVIKNEKTV